MKPPIDDLILTRHGAPAARLLAPRLADVWELTHPDRTDDWYSRRQFLERFLGRPATGTEPSKKGYVDRPGFLLIAAWVGGELAAYLYVFDLDQNTQWLADVTPRLPDAYVSEDGKRSLGEAEYIVAPKYQGHGVAGTLHEQLADLPHPRFLLLVEPDNKYALRAYRRMGYKAVGTYQIPGYPKYTAMVLDRSPDMSSLTAHQPAIPGATRKAGTFGRVPVEKAR